MYQSIFKPSGRNLYRLVDLTIVLTGALIILLTRSNTNFIFVDLTPSGFLITNKVNLERTVNFFL